MWRAESSKDRKKREQRMRGERAREAAQMIRAAQGKGRMVSVTEVEVRNDEGESQFFWSKDEVENIVKERLAQQFRLMESTPFMQMEW